MCFALSPRLRAPAAAVLALALWLGLPGIAWAQRLALVVGNSAYTAAAPLPNARTDAEDMAKALTRLGFEVTLLTDTGHAGFLDALDGFAAAAEEAETTLFFFSGHGFQLGGVNYLAPVDARLTDRAAIETETWRLDAVITRLQSRNRQTLILLDACRNNPLPPSMQGSAPEGLAQPETGANTFVAFATQPNNITLDGHGRNSPFTGALLQHIDTRGISISDMMIRVRNEVEVQTMGRQTPWDQSSLRAQFYFSPATEGVHGLTDAAELEALAELEPARRQAMLQLLSASGVVTDVAGAMAAIEALLAARHGGAEEEAEAGDLRVAGLPPDAREETRGIPPFEGLIREPGIGLDPPLPDAPDDPGPPPMPPPPPRPEPPPIPDEQNAAEPDPLPPAVWMSDAPGTLQSLADRRPVLLHHVALPAAQTARRDPTPPRIIIGTTPAPEDDLEPLPENLAVGVQQELARLGCYTMRIDGAFGPGSRGALTAYLEARGLPTTNLDPTEAVWRQLRTEPDERVCQPPVAAPTPTPTPTPARTTAPTAAAPQPTRPATTAPTTPPRQASPPAAAAPSGGRTLGSGRIGGLR